VEAEDLIAWRKAYMLSRQQLADLLGVHYSTMERWEGGKSRIPNMVPLALETLAGQRQQLVKSIRRHQERQQLRRLGHALGMPDVQVPS
jgi:transcriptional regulator with XRE-family HTH domain